MISLLGLVSLTFAYLFSTAQRFMIQSVNSTSSQAEASFALEHIKKHLQAATAIAIPTAGTSDSRIEFSWQEMVGGVVTDRTSRYQLNGSNLEYIANTGIGAVEVIARGIQTITFNRATAVTVFINLTVQRSAGGDTRQMRLQTSVSPRGIFQ